jgi:uncharacterized membrane protein YgdD (TMEM256/DUF423 family)
MNNQDQQKGIFFIRTAAILGVTGVILGAFGAHALERMVSPENVETFETGVRYHLLHAVMIAVIGVWAQFGYKKALKRAAWCFLIGIILFSGSIYLLSIREIFDLGSWLGPITPIGGTLFIAGWIFLLLASYQKSS